MTSLRKKTLSGLLWTVIDTFVLRGMSFLSTVILARWLGPEEFGILGMIAIFIAIGASIMDSGMSSSLIRMEAPQERDYSTVFLLNLGLSTVFYLLIFAGAPFIAKFYQQPILTDLVRVYALSFIIGGLSAVQLAILNREMQFQRIMKQNIPGIIVGVVVGLLFGHFGYGVWSIVIMHLTTQIIQSFVLWICSDWRPSFVFSKESAKYHFGFGYKLMLSGIMNIVFQNIYNIIIGRFYSLRELGYFERSKAFNDYPVSVLTSVMTKVTYPLLTSIQSEKERISQVYRQIMRLAFFVTCPLMFGAAAIAHPLFELVLGKEWTAAVPYFQILCLSSIFYPIHAFNLNVFKVYGRSELFLKLEIVKKIIIVIGLFIGFQFGIMGLVWSSVICNYLALFINTYYSAGMINYSGNRQFLDMLPTLITAGLMFGSTYFILQSLSTLSSISLVGLGAMLCAVIYAGLNYLIKSEPLVYGLSMLKSRKITI